MADELQRAWSPRPPPRATRTPTNRPFVSLMSDWGARDPSPAICRGVVLNIAPDALIVDITHEVEKYNIRHGALMLWCALPFLPSAHTCASSIRASARSGGRSRSRPAAATSSSARTTACSCPARRARRHRPRARDRQRPVPAPGRSASTFHGRDLFYTGRRPPGGRACQIEEIGPPLDPSELVTLDWPPWSSTPAGWRRTSSIATRSAT